MFSEPRVYQTENDLDAMRDLLRQGRLANNGSYYVHPGDLNWWLFYPPMVQDFWGSIYLWDDPDQPGEILAWALIPPDGSTFDVVLRPALRGSPLAWETYHWTVRQATSLARGAGCESTSVFWISEHDTLLRGWLVEQGFGLTRQGVNMECDLAVPGPAGKAPEGSGGTVLTAWRRCGSGPGPSTGPLAPRPSSSALLSASPASWDRRSRPPRVTWWR